MNSSPHFGHVLAAVADSANVYFARDSRLFEERKGVYAQLADYLHVYLTYLFDLRPARGNSERERPEEVAYERYRDVRAAVATIGSQDLITAVDGFSTAAVQYEFLAKRRLGTATQTDEEDKEVEEAYEGVRHRFKEIEHSSEPN